MKIYHYELITLIVHEDMTMEVRGRYTETENKENLVGSMQEGLRHYKQLLEDGYTPR